MYPSNLVSCDLMSLFCGCCCGCCCSCGFVVVVVVVVVTGDTFRYEPYDCGHHMGLGAASHMSSVAEPAEYWLKRGSVIEQVSKPSS